MAYRRVSTATKHKRGWRSTARKNLGIRKNTKFGRRRKTRRSGFGLSHHQAAASHTSRTVNANSASTLRSNRSYR